MKLTLVGLLSLAFSALYGQEKENAEVYEVYVERHQTVANFLAPGITHEFRVSPGSTLTLRAQIFPVAYFSTTYEPYDYYGPYYYDVVDNFQFDLRPALDVEYRHYYNFASRERKGRKTAHNSANFVSFLLRGLGPALLTPSEELLWIYGVGNFAMVAGPQWGIQRNYGKRFNLQLAVGPGLSYDTEFQRASFTLLGDLFLGFRLGK